VDCSLAPDVVDEKKIRQCGKFWERVKGRETPSVACGKKVVNGKSR
jgi:hypothetical protein